MRLLLIGINFHPELVSTGKYSSEMAAYLVEQGHEVRVVTAPPYYPWWRVQPPYRWWQYRRETWRGVQVWRSPLWVPKRVNGWKRLLHLASFALFSAPLMLAQAPWRPQVVLVVAPALAAAPVALLAARLSGARTWLHLQDFEVDAALNLSILPPAGLVARGLRAWEQGLLQRFDVVSTISGRMAERLREKGVPAERIVLFPNWVDTAFIRPLSADKAALRRQFGLSALAAKVVALYAGNMGEKQGLELLLAAAGRLQNTSVHVVLCGEGAARRRLERQAKGLANVTFLPLQPTEKLNLLLNMADIHVLPQRADAADLVMPSKLTGMLASGQPVVATALPDTEVGKVVGQVGVLVPPGDAEALAQALHALAQDPQRRKFLGQQGRKYAEERLSKQVVLERFHQALLRLEDERQGRR